MIEKREVLRRLRVGHGIRQIQRDLGIHRTLIRDLKQLGWLNPESPLPEEPAIAAALEDRQNSQSEHLLDTWLDRMRSWQAAELSFVIIHQKLVAEGLKVSETTVRRYLHSQEERKLPMVVMVRVHEPGEVMEVDFCYFGMVHDPKSDRIRKAWGFSARLRSCRHAWREMVWDQRAETFFQCHIHAFEHFGGVPKKVVCDNLKAAVVQASWEDPVAHRGYQMLAQHYNFLIDPCLPRRPEHKGGVESDMKYVVRNFYRSFLVDQRELGHEVPDALDLQRALEAWSMTTAFDREIRGTGYTVRQMFEAEKPHLQPLPSQRWEPVAIGKALIRETGRIQFRNSFYSVPWVHIGKEVQVFATNDQVLIFLGAEEIARHGRALEPGSVQLNPAHQPPQIEAWLDATKERVRAVASQIGEATSSIACQILDRQKVDGLRPARSLVNLRRKFGDQALEAACRFALTYRCAEYLPVKHFLERGQNMKPDLPVPPPQNFTFARDAEEYGAAAGGSR